MFNFKKEQDKLGRILYSVWVESKTEKIPTKKYKKWSELTEKQKEIKIKMAEAVAQYVYDMMMEDEVNDLELYKNLDSGILDLQ